MDQSPRSFPGDYKPSGNLPEHESINSSKNKSDNVSTTTVCIPINGKTTELCELEIRLKNGLEKRKINDMTQLCERIKRTEERIGQFAEENRIYEADKEEMYLNELKQLQVLNEEITVKTNLLLSQTIDKLDLIELEIRLKYALEKYKIQDVTQLSERIRRTEKRIQHYDEENRIDTAEQETIYLQGLKQLKIVIEEIFLRKSISNNESVEETNQRKINYKNDMLVNFDNLFKDLTHMPCCAERTITELLIYSQQKLLGDPVVQTKFDSAIQSVKELRDQIQKEERFSKQIESYLQDLDRYVHSEDYLSMMRGLIKVLKEVRPLYLQEILRLMERSRKTASSINNRDIVLLVGVTGSGKSTTIQFLSGAKMKKIQVEIISGHHLEHITMDDPIKNSELSRVTCSPLSRSETRCIIPITVQFQKILGPHVTGEMIICDAPGFDDTAGPEIDIVNSVGVIEALKRCKSVKILALSSYRSLGDKGEGIQQLARILNDMIDEIKDKLDGIFYAFTKYPSTEDIHALLCDIQTSCSQSNNNALLPVLTHMVEKTKKSVEKIDPVESDPKDLIKKLKDMKGIHYPKEVFRFSISERTRKTISDQLQNYRQSIVCAMKYKDTDLASYYLNNFKVLNDLIDQDFVRDSYNDLIIILNETIKRDRENMMNKFSCCLASSDGLKEEDIKEYKTAHEFNQGIQKLKEHFASFVSADVLIENMLSELEKRYSIVKGQELHSSSVKIYLHSIRLLTNSFQQLESHYIKICQEFGERFEQTLIQSIPELISANEFKQIAERLVLISQCLPILNVHLNGQVEKKYQEIIKSVLNHLNSFSDEQNSILTKRSLSDDHIKTLQKHINLLKTATSISFECIGDLKKIYEECIGRIVTRFENTVLRIKERFHINGNHAFENIEQLVIEMELIRSIPEVMSKVDEIFYKSIHDIYDYMQRLADEAEKLLLNFDDASGAGNSQPLTQKIRLLKKCSWIDRIYPDAYNSLMRRICEELKQRVDQLESSLKQLNLSVAQPQNIVLAQKLIEKIETMKVFEDVIAFLKEYQERIYDNFSQRVQEVFDNIKKTFTLEDKTIDYFKQEVTKLEEMKNEYDNLYPARSYLRQLGYSNIETLNQEIEKSREQQQIELEKLETEKSLIESQLNPLNSIAQEYKNLSSSEANKGFLSWMIMRFFRQEAKATAYLKQQGYSNIEELNSKIAKTDEDYTTLRKSIEDKQNEFNKKLAPIESNRDRYNLLLNNSTSQKEGDFLREKGQQSYESLEETIEEKKKILKDHEKYYFIDKLDARLANDALIYINNCEKVKHDRVRAIAEETNDLLAKYLEEYNYLLNKKIERNFNNIIHIDKNDVKQYSEDLKLCLQELSSFEEYTLVSTSMRTAEKITNWRRKFSKYHDSLDTNMILYKISRKHHERSHLSIIIRALVYLDDFCTSKPVDKGFQALYNRYQIDIAQESRDAVTKVIDYLKKEDYENADLTLHDIVENVLDSTILEQIKYQLKHSLKKTMKNTETYAGRLERQEDCREIIETIEKIRFILNHHRIKEFIDEETRIALENFESKINEILPTEI